jgi:hypothetical protein
MSLADIPMLASARNHQLSLSASIGQSAYLRLVYEPDNNLEQFVCTGSKSIVTADHVWASYLHSAVNVDVCKTWSSSAHC